MIKFIEKCQVNQDETTNFWFDVDGEAWAISERNGTVKLLDCEGFPVEKCNDKGRILDRLLPYYHKCTGGQF